MRVVIVGGGLAGLSAAAELASRGAEVVLLEKGDKPGGKLSGWRDKDGDSIEHGIHGWWRQYFNFLDLMRTAGVAEGTLLPPIPSSLVYEDGDRRMFPEGIDRRLPTPLFILPRYYPLTRGRLRLVDWLSSLGGFAAAFGYEHARDIGRFDNQSIYAYTEDSGASRTLHDVLVTPFARSLCFDLSENLSAGAYLSAMSFYVVGHAGDDSARWCNGNPQELILDPIADFIRKKGGRIVTGVAVREIVAAPDGRVEGVRVGDGGTRIPLARIPEQGVLSWPEGNAPKWFVRRVGTGYQVLSAVCTHQGGQVVLRPSDQRLVCLLHGGVFDLSGQVVGPPPTRPLPTVPFTVEGDALVIGGTASLPTRVPTASIPPEGWFAWPETGAPAVLVRRAAGDGFEALSAVCVHQGGPIRWDAASRRLLCGKHPGVFDEAGNPLGGPPTRPLPRLECRAEGDELLVAPAGQTLPDPVVGPDGVVRGDFVILATDVAPARAILGASAPLLLHDDVRRALNLETTEVVVARLWLDRRLPPEVTSGICVTTDGSDAVIDSFSILSNWQDGFKGYDGTVLEAQLYIVKDLIRLPDEELVGRVLRELERRFPELRGAKVRKYNVNRHENFTLFSPGSHRNRPTTASSVPNLYFAGDWVRLDQPWFFMEKAVASGRLAANEILRRLGKPEVPILKPDPDEAFTRFMKGATRAWLAVKRRLQAAVGFKPMSE